MIRHDDWITKLYLNMTYTADGSIYTITTNRIHFNKLSRGKITPDSCVLTVKIQGSRYPVIKLPAEQSDMQINIWLETVLSNKFVCDSDSANNVGIQELLKMTSNLDDPFLTMQYTNTEYISGTLFAILSKLLGDDYKLISIDYQ